VNALPAVPATFAVSAPAYARLTVREAWIPMRDGTRLAVNLFFPVGLARGARLPVILEYLPYRKDDWSVSRDVADYSYFVRRGYVAARLDVRGTGRSEGRTPDREYSEQEQRDGEDAIAWLASRPWSNGKVGMMGISWGGFNAIQMAMRHPPALRAIIAVDASDDLFHDDIHYIDGIMHADEYELSMDLQTAETRVPDFPVSDAALRPRFDNPPWFLLYLRHQRDGAFWRRASLRPDYARIRIPVFMIGGFYDGYRDSIPRMLAGLPGTAAAIVGPWNHTFPHDAEPGPAIEWRATAVRWWDRWLKKKPNGIERMPKLTAYLRDWYPPGTQRATIPGSWRSFDAWPPRESASRTLYLTPERALNDTAPQAQSAQALRCVPSAGAEAGFWWGELTVDQRPLDALGLTYDSPPLAAPAAVLGEPDARLRVTASAPLANWYVRLEDVAPDGEVTLVTGAGRSGAQRDAATFPLPLEPKRAYALDVPLHLTSWVFAPGHRIRLAVTNALWPMMWPTPFPLVTTLSAGGADPSRLTLPLVPETGHRVAFPAVTEKPQLVPGVSDAGDTWPGAYTVTRDVVASATVVRWSGADGQRFPWGRESTTESLVYRQADCCAERSSVHGEAATTVALRQRTLTWSVVLDLTSDARFFRYRFVRRLTRDGARLRERVWSAAIRRDGQ
jgi:putative CocE/NonD family hydrolase